MVREPVGCRVAHGNRYENMSGEAWRAAKELAECRVSRGGTQSADEAPVFAREYTSTWHSTATF